MNPKKCTGNDYIHFLIATPRNYSCVEASKVSPVMETPLAHDAFTRLLYREEPNSNGLWQEIAPLIKKPHGF